MTPGNQENSVLSRKSLFSKSGLCGKFAVITGISMCLILTGCSDKEPGNESEGESVKAPATSAQATIKPKANPVPPKIETKVASQPAESESEGKPANSTYKTEVTEYDFESLKELCKNAGLPDPPNVNAFNPQMAAVLNDTITNAARQQTAEAIGKLGCLYHALAINREASDRAIACYQKAKSLDKESPEWPYYLGRMFFERSSLERALIELKESQALDSNYPRIYVWLGDLEMRREAFKNAKKNFKTYTELVPDNSYGYAGLAAAELALNELEAAHQSLRKALEIDPSSPTAHHVMGAYHKSKGEEALATKEANFVAAQIPRPNPLKWDPRDIKLWRTLGPTHHAIQRITTYARVGDLESVDMLSQALISDYPNNADLLSGIALIYLNSNQAEKALEYGQKAVKAAPNNAAAAAILSSCFFDQKDYETALTYADKAITLDNQLPTGYIARSQVLEMLDRKDEAVAAIKKAIEIQPANVNYYSKVGEILYSQAKTEQAREYYIKALQIGESQQVFPRHLMPVFLVVAQLEQQQNNSIAAKEYLNKALRIDASFEQAFSMLANILIDEGKENEAIEHCKAMAKQNPDIIGYAIRYGELLSKTGKPAEAIEYLQQLVQKQPHNARVHFILGLILSQNGQQQEAITSLQKTLNTNEQFQPAYTLLAQIFSTEGKRKEAIELLQNGMKNLPDSPVICNSLAWLLATSPEAELRNPGKAVELAQYSCESANNQNPNYLDTLAAAQAAAGNFDEAVKSVSLAIEVSKNQLPDSDLAPYQARLKLFQERKIYVEGN